MYVFFVVIQKETQPKPQPEKTKVKGRNIASIQKEPLFSPLHAFDSTLQAWFVFDMLGASQEQKGERGSKGQARGKERTSG